MGSNFTDYLIVAHRCLKLDGHLHVVEAASRFNDFDQFVKGIKQLGFAVVSADDLWKFKRIHAIKDGSRRDADMKLRF